MSEFEAATPKAAAGEAPAEPPVADVPVGEVSAGEASASEVPAEPVRAEPRKRVEETIPRGLWIRLFVYFVAGHLFAGFIYLLFELGGGQ